MSVSFRYVRNIYETWKIKCAQQQHAHTAQSMTMMTAKNFELVSIELFYWCIAIWWWAHLSEHLYNIVYVLWIAVRMQTIERQSNWFCSNQKEFALNVKPNGRTTICMRPISNGWLVFRENLFLTHTIVSLQLLVCGKVERSATRELLMITKRTSTTYIMNVNDNIKVSCCVCCEKKVHDEWLSLSLFFSFSFSILFTPPNLNHIVNELLCR